MSKEKRERNQSLTSNSYVFWYCPLNILFKLDIDSLLMELFNVNYPTYKATYEFHDPVRNDLAL